MSLPNLAELKTIHFLIEETASLELKLAKLEQEKTDLEEAYSQEKIISKSKIRQEIKRRKLQENQETELSQQQEAEKNIAEEFIVAAEIEAAIYFKSSLFAKLVEQVISKAEQENSLEIHGKNETESTGKIEVFADKKFEDYIPNGYKLSKSDLWPLAVVTNSKIYDLNPETLQQILISKLAIRIFNKK